MKIQYLLIAAGLLAVAVAYWYTQLRSTGDDMEAGKKFLEENAKKEGIKVTASGLQYEVIREGTGPKPGPTTTVEVHYEGRLINGSVFDSSYQRNETISFPLNRVIPGWTEGLQLMPTGSKYRLYIPSELGYGARGAGGDIPPHAALIFDVELISLR
jgi:FKBP-type peptidyl-prolyl cis-trans isomerase